ncbi:MAG: FecR domain-containing protein [Spirochaetes bacterium]|nr:FecR domain-containing protein [Spirochaetota bacterium]
MKKNNKWQNWIKKINEEELSQLLSANEKNYKLNSDTDKNTLKMIKNLDNENKKKKTEKERIVFKKPLFNYSFTTVMILFMVMAVSVIINEIKKIEYDIDKNCIITKLEGEVVLTDRSRNTKKRLELNDMLNKNSTIKTSANALAQISFYNRSISLISEKSELSVLNLDKQQNFEQIILKQESGSGIFIPVKTQDNFIFNVYTDALIIKTIGTEFTVDVAESKDTKVLVYEGIINVILNINRNTINDIIKINSRLGKKLEEELSIGEKIIKDQQITVCYNNIKKIDEKLLEIYSNLKNYAVLKPQEKRIIDEKNRQLAHDIESLINSSLIIENSILKFIQKKLKINRLPKSTRKKLTEKFTYFFTDDKNLYIASDSNREIYCINSINGNIIWEFTDFRLKNITSVPVFFNGHMISSGPNHIFIIEKNGSPFLIQKINKGPSFWPESINFNGKLYIPGFEDIHVYDKTNFTILKNFVKSPGQIYISAAGGKLFCTYSSLQKISIYDLEKKQEIWVSEILNAKVFMPPLVTVDIIYFADDTNTLYKYDYKKNKSEKLFIGTGVISNLILKYNYIYFVANNGYFYRINVRSFNNAEQLSRVDYDPNPDKYLTKKLLYHNDELYFSSDTGKLFKYDMIEKKCELITIDDNKSDLPLISTPVRISNAVYVIDSLSNVYRANY